MRGFLFLILIITPKLWATQSSSLVWHDDSGFNAVMGCQRLPQTIEFDGPLLDLSEQILRVAKVPPQASNAPFDLQNSIFEASRDEDGRLIFLRCPMGSSEEDYLLFKVFQPGQVDAVAEVGVTETDLALFSSTPPAAVKTQSLTAGIQVIEGALEHVVCTSSSVLNVRDESLSKVIFTVAKFDPVKPVQSWDISKQQKVISGKTYTFIKAQFPNRNTNENVGWVAEEYVMPKSKCPGVPQIPKPIEVGGDSWVFPTIKRTSSNYKTGMRAFKASRGGGSRYHAACDLYRVVNEQAVSAYSGTVIRDRYYFYQGTYALEVRHTGGKVARYGEITGKAASGVSSGRTVKPGQVIGYIGKVNSNCCTPMLHFELYSGTSSGSLTQSGNKFQRRRDLMDPSALLTEWEKAKFGTSY